MFMVLDLPSLHCKTAEASARHIMQANVFPLPPAEFVVIPLPAELRHHRYVPAIKREGPWLPTLQERIDSNCLNSYCLLLPPTILETHACGGIEHPRRGQG